MKNEKGLCLRFEGVPVKRGFPGGSVVKNLPVNAGDSGLVPGSGRSSGGGNGSPLQYSCLENLIDKGAWWATVHGVAKNRTRLSICYTTLQSKQVYKPNKLKIYVCVYANRYILLYIYMYVIDIY